MNDSMRSIRQVRPDHVAFWLGRALSYADCNEGGAAQSNVLVMGAAGGPRFPRSSPCRSFWWMSLFLGLFDFVVFSVCCCCVVVFVCFFVVFSCFLLVSYLFSVAHP